MCVYIYIYTNIHTARCADLAADHQSLCLLLEARLLLSLSCLVCLYIYIYICIYIYVLRERERERDIIHILKYIYIYIYIYMHTYTDWKYRDNCIGLLLLSSLLLSLLLFVR